MPDCSTDTAHSTENVRSLPLLPMAGHTAGNRTASPATCGAATRASTAPNTRTTATSATCREARPDAASGLRGRGRRAGPLRRAARRPRRAAGRGVRPPATRRLPFTAIAPVSATVDDVTVPPGYRWDPIIRWGDPIFRGATRSTRNQTPARQAQQFGYNNDYLDIIETNRAGTRAILVGNHEYTNENIMFPPGTTRPSGDPHRSGPHTGCPSSSCARQPGEPWTYVAGRAAEPPDHAGHAVRQAVRRPARTC